MVAMISACFDVGEFVSNETRLGKRMPRGEAVLVTKCPGEERLAPVLLPLDHQLWFIFMLRDPRDVVVSEHIAAPGRYWSDLQSWRQAAAIYDQLKNHPRFIVVRYEDLVRDPDKVQRELAARMSFLKTTAPFSQYSDHVPQNAARPARPRQVSMQSIGNWHQHLPRIKAQFSAFSGMCRRLVEFGYEPDDSWLRALDGVQPLEQKSLGRPMSPRRRLRIALRRVKAYGVYIFRRYTYI